MIFLNYFLNLAIFIKFYIFNKMIISYFVIFKFKFLIKKIYIVINNELMIINMRKIKKIGENLSEIPKILALKCTILKRNFIMDMQNENNIENNISINQLYENCYQKNYNNWEMLAIQDTLFLEFCCLTLQIMEPNFLYDFSINHNDNEVAQIIFKEFKKTQIYDTFSPKLTENEEIKEFKARLSIPKSIYENFPFLKSVGNIGDNEKDEHYRNR